MVRIVPLATRNFCDFFTNFLIFLLPDKGSYCIWSENVYVYVCTQKNVYLGQENNYPTNFVLEQRRNL